MNNDQNRFNKIKLEIAQTVFKSDIPTDPSHSIDTLQWVKKINPKADECLQIAALAHDIDRAISPRIIQKINETYDNYKKKHAIRSSKIIADLMNKHGYFKKDIEKTCHMVKNHEVGGDDETNILMDADSISYFSCDLEWYFQYKGLEKTKDKIKFMYQRATPRAKEIISNLNIKNKELKNICKEIFR